MASYVGPESSDAFPFLRLPAEIRNMVYEKVAESEWKWFQRIRFRRADKLTRKSSRDTSYKKKRRDKVIARRRDLALLFVNKQLYTEHALFVYRSVGSCCRTGFDLQQRAALWYETQAPIPSTLARRLEKCHVNVFGRSFRREPMLGKFRTKAGIKAASMNPREDTISFIGGFVSKMTALKEYHIDYFAATDWPSERDTVRAMAQEMTDEFTTVFRSSPSLVKFCIYHYTYEYSREERNYEDGQWTTVRNW